MDLTAARDIQDILNKYGAIGVATAPLGATLLGRLVFGKSKMMTNMVRISAGWLAARAFLTPHLDQMKETLVNLTATIHNSGY
jgi:hypothetical protein